MSDVKGMIGMVAIGHGMLEWFKLDARPSSGVMLQVKFRDRRQTGLIVINPTAAQNVAERLAMALVNSTQIVMVVVEFPDHRELQITDTGE